MCECTYKLISDAIKREIHYYKISFMHLHWRGERFRRYINGASRVRAIFRGIKTNRRTSISVWWSMRAAVWSMTPGKSEGQRRRPWIWFRSCRRNIRSMLPESTKRDRQDAAGGWRITSDLTGAASHVVLLKETGWFFLWLSVRTSTECGASYTTQGNKNVKWHFYGVTIITRENAGNVEKCIKKYIKYGVDSAK